MTTQLTVLIKYSQSLSLQLSLIQIVHYPSKFISKELPAPVIKTADTIIANNKHFTKYKVATRWRTQNINMPRGDTRDTHARLTITAGATSSSSSSSS